jgi:hypothetical protein
MHIFVGNIRRRTRAALRPPLVSAEAGGRFEDHRGVLHCSDRTSPKYGDLESAQTFVAREFFPESFGI